MTETSRFRIGIDVGGTFTDFVVADMAQERFLFHKEPSVPSDPSLSVERGMAAIFAEHAIMPGAVELVVHGTTIGLNAIIQRRGARMAMVVSRGNRDVLEIARLRLPSSYDFTVPREVPLVPRRLMFEVPARLRADGHVEERPDAASLDSIAAAIAAARVDAVAVMLLNAYRDPTLEREVADALRARLPGVPVTESSVLWPEVREYERALVGGLNAYIQPLMTAYFDRLKARVEGLGVRGPIYITANNGGTLSLETARARPIDTVLSGPASGVVAATRIGAAAERRELVTIDMGGTSADISIVQAGVPEFTTATFVGDFPLMMPVVNVGAIGAGGGSILWVDAQGVLKVGPASAGADPGPVCYGRGGTEPTITDCYVSLGIVDPTRFLGGRMQLDATAARAALDGLAERLGIAGDDRALAAAEAALRVASAKMATELTKLMATAGVDPRRYALVAFGGAGPTHANLLAEEAGLAAVLVPTAPGTFCALGAILADVRRDYVRTARHLVVPPEAAGVDEWPKVAAVIAALEAEALGWIAQEGALVGAHGLVVSLRVRYPDQAYELEIIVPESERAGLGARSLAALFHAEHQRLYGFVEAASPVQVTTVRLGVIGRVPPVSLPKAHASVPTVSGTRMIRHRGREIAAAVYERAAIGAGSVIDGPAIVEQPDTTVWILPGWRAEADALGTLHLAKGAAAVPREAMLAEAAR
ncbi:hydantoinase/oxoprolinase family protein [Elioraea sp.]|uniref:hydantoinase/oxoprolinase family protein n=1 Tax=Elioraea sp. TaxID=2185103 RepID=UPI0025BA1225|nr:hydantoinase/oxoprolinase family protein [Elioraea sp.]